MCELIALGGNLEAMKWARRESRSIQVGKTDHPSLENKRARILPFDRDYRTCCNAARGGNLELLKWLREQNCPWDETTFASAALNGDLSMTQWLHDEACCLNNLTFYNAAYRGHLELLKWLRNKGYRWERYGAEICSGAAKNAKLDILQVNAYCCWLYR